MWRLAYVLHDIVVELLYVRCLLLLIPSQSASSIGRLVATVLSQKVRKRDGPLRPTTSFTTGHYCRAMGDLRVGVEGIIKGLAHRHQLNGLAASVTALEDHHGMIQVKVKTNNDVVRIKPQNLAHGPNVNNFQAGDEVVLHSLSRQDLNGVSATFVETTPSTGRCCVRLPDQTIISVKNQNLALGKPRASNLEEKAPRHVPPGPPLASQLPTGWSTSEVEDFFREVQLTKNFEG